MADNATPASGIEVRSLYKVFGANAAHAVDLVKQGISKAELNEKHGNVLGLKDINLEMPGGCIQVIMGLSGSGKSTLIRHINRLINPTAGEVLVGGTDVVKMNEHDLREFRRKNTAMVFQKFALLPHRTVLDNTVYGLKVRGVPRKQQVDEAMRWINRVGLDGFENRYPNQLSGGMQQRVGLARALTNDAPILLMDEAFSALDPLIRTDMQGVLLDLQKEIKKTVVFITHDLDEALRLGDRIAILRDGEVIQQGTGQEIVLHPADPYIEKFVREVNRSRVLLASSVMTPLSEPGASEGLSIAAEATLENALHEMVRADVRTAHCLDADGRPAGALTLYAVASAMVTPSEEPIKGKTDHCNNHML
ncbi:glycine betaine/L-proline ABC transporter ATP-binding protein [Mesorhizobium sp. GR13]|uniref:quaternary amine ABC transporter ATP-binding protein n=1 Tax=Mesorhizobium sp. GR13 TaxID=2562308 RepID=UPI0010C06F2F|nr:glycine betaine/L-proline ABC transporter ATP-binding protein [Mesorhizobium sp. GR13]